MATTDATLIPVATDFLAQAENGNYVFSCAVRFSAFGVPLLLKTSLIPHGRRSNSFDSEIYLCRYCEACGGGFPADDFPILRNTCGQCQNVNLRAGRFFMELEYWEDAITEGSLFRRGTLTEKRLRDLQASLTELYSLRQDPIASLILAEASTEGFSHILLAAVEVLFRDEDPDGTMNASAEKIEDCILLEGARLEDLALPL